MAGRHRADGARPKRAGRVVETSDYVAMLTRQLVAFGDRIGADPIALVHLRELEITLSQQVNRGVFLANEAGGYSQNDMAAILGVTRQAIAKRVHLGQMVHAAVVEARGGGGLVRLGEIRARRARLALAAGVEDRTGSDRERTTLRAVGE